MRFFFIIFMSLGWQIIHAQANHADSSADEGTVVIKLVPARSNSIFKRNKVRYTAKFFNKYNEEQEGKALFVVKTDKGKKIAQKQYAIKISPQGLRIVHPKFVVPSEGFYEVTLMLNLTSYDDTVKTVFGVRPQQINTPLHKPADFDEFWKAARKELKAVNPNYKVTYDEAQSTSTHKVYLVEMTSLNQARIHGWLTIPRIGGVYPILIGYPGYRAVLKPLFADEIITFQLNIRSGKTEEVEFPQSETEYLLYNIHDKKKYIYRGVYMDCIRAIDFFTDNQTFKYIFDLNRIAVYGGSQGGSLALVTSAMDSRVKACVIDNPVFCDMHNFVEIASSRKPYEFPMNKYKDYMSRTATYSYKSILETMDYYDPQNFAEKINCPVLLGLGLLDKLAPPATIFAAFNKLSNTCKKQSEYYCFYELGHEVTERHLKFHYLWMMEKLAHPMKEFDN